MAGPAAGRRQDGRFNALGGGPSRDLVCAVPQQEPSFLSTMSSPAEPCLSVVMPCYNEAGTVRAVIERVLQSPYVQEVIVIDDASTDGTGEIVRDIADQRVFLHVQDMNQGKGAALRRGVAECSAQYVIIHDTNL